MLNTLLFNLVHFNSSSAYCLLDLLSTLHILPCSEDLSATAFRSLPYCYTPLSLSCLLAPVAPLSVQLSFSSVHVLITFH